MSNWVTKVHCVICLLCTLVIAIVKYLWYNKGHLTPLSHLFFNLYQSGLAEVHWVFNGVNQERWITNSPLVLDVDKILHIERLVWNPFLFQLTMDVQVIWLEIEFFLSKFKRRFYYEDNTVANKLWLRLWRMQNWGRNLLNVLGW